MFILAYTIIIIMDVIGPIKKTVDKHYITDFNRGGLDQVAATA